MGFGCLLPYTTIKQRLVGKEKAFINMVPNLGELGAPLVQAFLLCKTQKFPCSPKD